MRVNLTEEQYLVIRDMLHGRQLQDELPLDMLRSLQRAVYGAAKARKKRLGLISVLVNAKMFTTQKKGLSYGEVVELWNLDEPRSNQISGTPELFYNGDYGDDGNICPDEALHFHPLTTCIRFTFNFDRKVE